MYSISSDKLMEILGHNEVEKALAKAISSNKIFPTWIFCGPFGVGKASIATKFAKCLLSDKVVPGESLDIVKDDPVNSLVDKRTHPDFFVLEQTTEAVSIDEIRELMLKIRKKPTISKWRVVLIENASYFNKNIYNSLLKILEEPPKDTVIILICQNIGYMPKTLLSRASKINFNPIDDVVVKKILDKIGVGDSIELTKLSDGSVGYALYLEKHGGLKVFYNLLSIFDSYKNKKYNIEYLFEGDLNENFKMIKEMLTKLLKLYIETLTETIDVKKYEREISIFKNIISKYHPNIDVEAKKVIEIISMLNKSEALMLDKSSVIVYAFEKFFNFF